MALPEARADGLVEVTAGDEVTPVVHRDRKLRQGTGGRAEDDGRTVGDVELRLVAGAEKAMGVLLGPRHGASHVRDTLRVGDEAACGPVLRVLHLVVDLGTAPP